MLNSIINSGGHMVKSFNIARCIFDRGEKNSNTRFIIRVFSGLIIYSLFSVQTLQGSSATVAGGRVNVTVKYLPFADTPRSTENTQCKLIGQNQLCWYHYAKAAELTCDSNDNWRWMNGGEASKLYVELCDSA